MAWFDEAFASLPDPRTGNATRHDLLEVLTIALTATITIPSLSDIVAARCQA